jgi:methyl-accepting chemotaxis protein
VEDTLDLILQRASKTGEVALTRVMGLGVTELAQSVGFVGRDIVGVLGQSKNVSRLYNAFRDFFNRAYESVMELLGRQLAETAAKQVLEWIQELKEGANLIDIVEKFYQTEQTAENLQQLADSSTANLEQFITIIQSVSKLDAAYRQQINWAENVLQGFKWFGTLSAAALPQGELLIAALCITLGGYVILVGADYVDSPKLTLLNCVPGIRHIVEIHLATHQ